MNNISIIGNLTRDVELKQTSSGTDYAKFDVAVPSKFKSQNGEKKTNFFKCTAFGERGKTIAKFFSKGKPIGITGSMECTTKTADDGSSRSYWELNVENFSFINGANNTEETAPLNTYKKTDMSQIKVEAIEDDNLPF